MECGIIEYMATPRKDYTNIKVGRLLAVKFVDMDQYSNARWLFRCDCGKEVIRPAYCVVSNGSTHSCGCLGDESRVKVNTTEHSITNEWNK